MSGIILPKDFQELNKVNVLDYISELGITLSIGALQTALCSVLQKTTHNIDENKIAICLSGGVDSSILLTLMNSINPNISPLTIFTDQDNEDLSHAKKLLTHLQRSKHILEQIDPDKPDYNKFELLCEAALKNNITDLILGVGADELQGGYHAHLEPLTKHPFAFSVESEIRKTVFKDFWNELVTTKLETLNDIAKKFNISIHLPYLEIAGILNQVPMYHRVGNAQTKVLFKIFAQELGIPREIVYKTKAKTE